MLVKEKNNKTSTKYAILLFRNNNKKRRHYYVEVSGKEIKKKNSYNVKIKEKGKSSGKSKFNGYGSSVSFPKKITKNVTITYPKNYKDLCILCYGYREHDRLANDNKIDFTKRTKNDKLYFHGMRVK